MEEKKKSVTMNGIIYGIITAIMVIVFSLILYIFNLHMNRSVSWIGYLFLLAGMIWGTLEYRKKTLGGFMSYGKAFSVSFMIILFAGIIYCIYTYFFFQFIAPGSVNELIEMQRQQIAESNVNLTDEQIEQALEISARFMTPIWIAVLGFVQQLIIGAIVCLITSIFLKKEDKSLSAPV